MATLNLKNKYYLILFLFFSCKNNRYDKEYLMTNDLNYLRFENCNKKNVLKSKFVVKRNNRNINTGNFIIFSEYDSKTFSTELKFQKHDTIFKKDSLIFYIELKKYYITSFQEKGLKSSGNPSIKLLNINGEIFDNSNAVIKVK